MNTHEWRKAEETRAQEYFLAHTTDHILTIQHDQGVYRHLRFSKPGTGIWSFNLTTWPGHLAITGDLEHLVFRRVHDMLPFFTTPQINPSYWGEKVTAGRVETYNWDYAKTVINESLAGCAPSFKAAVTEEILDMDDEYTHPGSEDELRRALDKHFDDGGDWDLRTYDWHFLLACHAIRWGATLYLALKHDTQEQEHAS